MTDMHTAMYESGERRMEYERKMYPVYIGMKILETCKLVYHAVQHISNSLIYEYTQPVFVSQEGNK